MNTKTNSVEKVNRFDYENRLGLSKSKGITLLWGCGINFFPKTVVTWLANYGLFVYLTRSLAGKESYTDREKLAIINEKFQWLAKGMPHEATEKVTKDAFTVACDKIMASDGTPEQKKAGIAALENAFGKVYSK